MTLDEKTTILRLPLHPGRLPEDLPLFEIRETPSHYLLRLDIESLFGQGISIELGEETLILCGKRIDPHDFNKKRITLRVDSHRPALTAHYREGILIIALPKSDPRVGHHAP